MGQLELLVVERVPAEAENVGHLFLHLLVGPETQIGHNQSYSSLGSWTYIWPGHRGKFRV